MMLCFCSCIPAFSFCSKSDICLSTGHWNGVSMQSFISSFLFWQCDPHQSQRMAHAAELLLPHCADLRRVCQWHQSNQIPHHLSICKCILFSFAPLSSFKNIDCECLLCVGDKVQCPGFYAPGARVVWEISQRRGHTISPDDGILQ